MYICVSLFLCVFYVYISAIFYVFHCSVIYNFLTIPLEAKLWHDGAQENMMKILMGACQELTNKTLKVVTKYLLNHHIL